MKLPIKIFTITLLSFLLASCGVMTSIELQNNMHETISAISTHSKKAYDIDSNSYKRIPHTTGDIIVNNKNGIEITRITIAVPDYETEKASIWESLPLLHHVTVPVELSSEGKLKVLKNKKP